MSPEAHARVRWKVFSFAPGQPARTKAPAPFAHMNALQQGPEVDVGPIHHMIHQRAQLSHLHPPRRSHRWLVASATVLGIAGSETLDSLYM